MGEDIFEDEKPNSNDQSRNREILAVRNIMKNEDGRNFMWSQLQYCSVFESIFNKDTNQHSYNAGLREAGLNLSRKLKEAAPDEYLKMIKENM